MLRAFPLAAAAYLPLTCLICLGAIAVSIGSMFGLSTDPFILDDRAFWLQPWRLLTTTLPHGSAFHLFFNVYWAWTLGGFIEHYLGRRAWIAATLSSMVAASAMQFAFTGTPIGLSGVVYAYFGLTWVLSKRTHRFAGIIDRTTSMIFMVWLVLCIVLTQMGMMNVANIAHIVGLIIGLLCGVALTARDYKRPLAIVSVSALIALSLAGSSPLRGSLQGLFNPAAAVSKDLDYAYQLLERKEYELALPIFERIWKSDPSEITTLSNLGQCYAMVGTPLKFLDVVAQWETQIPGMFRYRLKPEEIAFALITTATYSISKADIPAAKALAEKAFQIAPKITISAQLLASIAMKDGDQAAARAYLTQALTHSPNNPDLTQALREMDTLTPPKDPQ